MATFTYESNTFSGELATNNIWLGFHENERINLLATIHKDTQVIVRNVNMQQ